MKSFKIGQKFWRIDCGFVEVIKENNGKTTSDNESYYFIEPVYVCDICHNHNDIEWAYAGKIDYSKEENKGKFTCVRSPVNESDQVDSDGSKLHYGVFKTKRQAIKEFKDRYSKSRRLRFSDLSERSGSFDKKTCIIPTEDK